MDLHHRLYYFDQLLFLFVRIEIQPKIDLISIEIQTIQSFTRSSVRRLLSSNKKCALTPFDSLVSLCFSYAVRTPVTLTRAKSVCPSALKHQQYQ
jgi:hypothetical protein